MTEKTLPRKPSWRPRRCARGQANEGFQQIGGGGGALDEFARACAHRIHDDLRLIQIADGKNGAIGHFLVQQFNALAEPAKALSAGMSTRVTSGLAARTRRVTGSAAAIGKLAQVCTVRATLVPSTSTCNTCSLLVIRRDDDD